MTEASATVSAVIAQVPYTRSAAKVSQTSEAEMVVMDPNR